MTKGGNMSLKKFIPCVAVAFLVACGDDDSFTPKVPELPGEVADMDELKEFECSDDLIGEKVYVKDQKADYECDGDHWFEAIETGKSSSSSKKKSSSSSAKSSSSDDSTNSSTGSSPSSSSSSSVKSSSSVASSSSVKSSSSSSIESSSSSVAPATPCKTDSTDTCEYGSVKDERDGQTYKTVKIGDQWWMAENLNYAYLQPTASEDSSSFCYDNLPENCEKYGRLYLWSAMVDSAGVFPENTKTKGCGQGVECHVSETIRGVCPKGWHVPDKSEWWTLGDAMDGFYDGEKDPEDVIYWGDKLKTTSGWSDESGVDKNGIDEYGFSALPGGFAWVLDPISYQSLGTHGRFWSTQEMGACCGVFLNVFTAAMLDDLPKSHANSIRCVKD